MKRNLLIIVALVGTAALAIGGFFFWRGRSAPQPAVPTPEPKGVLIETPLEERPYVTLTPSSDGHWLTISVSRIRDASILEYELLYDTASGAIQGTINTVDLKGEISYSKEILLGSESRGHYKYDEGVTEGKLTIRLRGDKGTRKFNSDFHLQQGVGELTSIAGKFKSTGKLSPSAFYITMLTIGLPREIEGEVVGGPYGVFTSGNTVVKNGRVALTLSEEAPSAKLYSWDGASWGEEKKDVEIDGEKVSASVDSLATFVAISSE